MSKVGMLTLNSKFIYFFLIQRYEYSPLVDDIDTDDEEDIDEVKTKSNLTQNLKKRGGDGSVVAQIDQDEKMVWWVIINE